MPVILVPYHLDEYVPDLDVPLPADRDVTTVVAALPDGDVWTRMRPLYERVADAVEAAARTGAAPTVVSGDCTTSLGVVAGLQHAGVDPAIVWFDAHGDVQTPETTASGYVGGMPLRILVGYRPQLVAQRLRLRAIPESRAVLVDARDLDPPEVEYLAAADIRRADVDGLTTSALPEGPLVLHLDLDVVDPDELPGLRFPAPGGPAVADVLAAARRVLDTGRVAALSVGCTWHPGEPPDPPGVRARLLSALMRPPDVVDAMPRR
jgi:arginase